MKIPTYLFYTYKDGLTAQNIEVFSYPMGDTTVRAVPGTELVDGNVQVLWITAPVVDWSVVRCWSDFVSKTWESARRVLVLPYLPSARGDKDVPSPARINGEMAAHSGITDIITIDPHSDVWLSSMRKVNPRIQQHVLPLGYIVDTVVMVDAINSGRKLRYSGVISPDKGAVARATEVATALGIPVHVASKNRDPKTGHLTNYSFDVALEPGEYLVVDDIFDGGGTFALLTDAVNDNVVLDLWVTHGGFTKPNFSENARRPYRRVYTTDSLRSAVLASLDVPSIHLTYLFGWVIDAIEDSILETLTV